jgi:Leucine-rich repeat (LRR) protein
LQTKPESGRRLASSKGKRQPARTGEESRLTSTWSQGDALVNWSLILARQNLKKVPDYVFRRVNLRDLQLTGNALTKIPKDIARLEHLNVLKLDENQLDRLPTELALLHCLQILDVSENQILDLDDQFVLPRNLLEARFSNNKIRQLPHFFFILSNLLQVLDLSVNELELLPSSPWKELPNLQ